MTNNSWLVYQKLGKDEIPIKENLSHAEARDLLLKLRKENSGKQFEMWHKPERGKQ